MEPILKAGKLGALLSLLLLCSCATSRPPLPADVSMNQEAGRGRWLIAMVRVDNGEPLPFIVDTGAPITCLDKSLEPTLGKRRADVNAFNIGDSLPGGVYRAPKLYLGNTPLQKSGAYVITLDCQHWSKPAHYPFKGFLGMDVLKHYCVQLDFQNGHVRFLDGEHANKKDWGRPFHLTSIGDGCFAISDNLTGAKGPRSMIDTGADGDGDLMPKLFQQWTNHVLAPARGEVRSPDGMLGGEIYHGLELAAWPATDHDSHSQVNMIGIHVLSQNLVTLDFPNRTLYLKRTSDWALTDKATEAAMMSVAKSAAEFSHGLKEKGQLPGWAKDDAIANGKADAHWTHQTNGLDLVTFDAKKEGDSSVYHYTFTRASSSRPWKLEKAWRTDQGDKTIEEFRVP